MKSRLCISNDVTDAPACYDTAKLPDAGSLYATVVVGGLRVDPRLFICRTADRQIALTSIIFVRARNEMASCESSVVYCELPAAGSGHTAVQDRSVPTYACRKHSVDWLGVTSAVILVHERICLCREMHILGHLHGTEHKFNVAMLLFELQSTVSAASVSRI
jgi:hypothetical protein